MIVTQPFALSPLLNPLRALGNLESEKSTRGLLFPRGLRRRRYFCVALRGFGRTMSSSSRHKKGLTRRSALRFNPQGLFYSEGRCPRRPSTKKGLTRRPTLRFNPQGLSSIEQKVKSLFSHYLQVYHFSLANSYHFLLPSTALRTNNAGNYIVIKQLSSLLVLCGIWIEKKSR